MTMENLLSIQAPQRGQDNHESKTLSVLRTGFDLFTLGGKYRMVTRILPNMDNKLQANYHVAEKTMKGLDYVKSALKVLAMFTLIVPLIAFAMTKAYSSRVDLVKI